MSENYEFFYQGTPSSLDNEYGNFTGYRMAHENIGSPTSIQTANQIREVSNLLNQGIKTVELQPISPEVFDQVPKQHFKEVNRLKKLTGAETTIHAPLVEPSGFTKEGWNEANREQTERHLKQVIEKAHILSPEGNMPVTVHASGIPGTEFIPTKEGVKEQQIIAVNRDTGQLVPIKREEEAYPEFTGEQEIQWREAASKLRSANATEWQNKITNLAFYKKEADEILNRAIPELSPISKKLEKGQITKKDMEEYAKPFQEIERADLFLEDVETRFRNMYSDAYKYSDDKQREKLRKIGKEWAEATEKMKEMGEKLENGEISKEEFIIERERMKIKETIEKSKLLDQTINQLGGVRAPEMFVPVEEFATEKAGKTFANVAFEGYKKYGDKAPIVSIENLYSGMAFSRADDMKKLIEKSKEEFMIKATKEGYSKSAAKKAADNLIGTTWDVGHLNMMRKQGFEKKDIIAETKKIAPYVKHVHLTDNFGFSDSHLPPGMGNVPIKDIMKELEKKGYEGKGIVEAGGWAQHFKSSPHPQVLQALGSPIYSSGGPYWNQIQGTEAGYFSGYGTFLPDKHFSMYGAGFEQLPVELGGQVQGKQDRFSGAPMQ